MASLRDIARFAGVSVRTVSRALSGHPYVSSEVRQRVLQAAEQIGYEPDLRARSLRTGRGYEVGVLVGTLDELHMAELAGIEERLREASLCPTLLFALDASSGPPEALTGLLGRRPAGMLALPGVPIHAPDWIKALNGLTLVVIDSSAAQLPCRVEIDRPVGICEAVLTLADEGHRRFAYVGPAWGANRLDGFRRGVTQAGVEADYLFMAASSDAERLFRDAEEAVAQWIEAPTGATVLQAWSDVLALGLLYGLQRRGVRVPDDVAVVGFDNRSASAYSTPPLTTVAQPNREAGRAAASLLCDCLSGQTEPQVVQLPTRLVRRVSA